MTGVNETTYLSNQDDETEPKSLLDLNLLLNEESFKKVVPSQSAASPQTILEFSPRASELIHTSATIPPFKADQNWKDQYWRVYCENQSMLLQLKSMIKKRSSLAEEIKQCLPEEEQSA